ncbi:MAG: hypothetical protein KF882_09495 [Bacteroidia bacterium]|nr:hypothetical protein [Bacteroidia bacterium]MCO5254912.1 hypothetical protein [Bacteroidota bacterium]
MRKITLLISILLVIILQSCFKEKKCPKPAPRFLEQEMLDWIVFQPGSYWIYIDSITGSYDSVYVSDVYTDTIPLDQYLRKGIKCNAEWRERVHIVMEQTYNNTKIELIGLYGVNSGVTNNINPVRGAVNIKNINQTSGDGGISDYMYFPVLQGTVGAWNGFTIITHDTLFATFKVFDKTYQNVLLVSDGYNSAVNAITKYYHAKHIGVVRKEIYKFKGFHDKDPLELLHVWELADYKVIQ